MTDEDFCERDEKQRKVALVRYCYDLGLFKVFIYLAVKLLTCSLFVCSF